MANPDTELDDITKLESPAETAHTVPLGWWILFWGLIVWGVYYLWTYSPALGGWSQAQDLDGGGAGSGSGTNLLATIAFTVLPTAAAIGLFLANRKRKKA